MSFPMNNAEFQLRGVGDPRLAVHATSALPAWLWSVDGVRILWANPVGARVFGAANGAELAKRNFGPADAHRRQVAQLAGRLPPDGAIRLERLRGFGAALGRLMTLSCARLDFADGSHGILIAAAEAAGRTMPLLERLQRLVEGVDTPIAAFASDGMFVGASDAARPLLGFRNLSEAGLEQARSDALKRGRVETPIGIGHMVLQRVGSGADVGLVALLAPAATQAASAETAPVEPAAERPMPDYEQPQISGEAPAEFALIDEFATPAPEEPAEAASNEWRREPAAPAAERPTPDYEQPQISGEAPAEYALIAESRQSRPHEPSPSIEAVADEPAPAPVTAPSWIEEPAPGIRRHPLRFMWQIDADGRFSLGSDEFTRLIGMRTAAGFGRLWSEIADHFRPRSRRPRAQGGRHPRRLERHHRELAGRWWHPVAGGIVGSAGVRCGAKFCRLSRIWRLPRSRRVDAAGGAAPSRIVLRPADTTNTFR